MTTNVLNTKASEVENKIPDHARYMTTQEFKKLIAENFAARLSKLTDFDNKLLSFDKKVTSNKTKYLEA